MNKLPQIVYNEIKYTYDFKLSQLRTMTDEGMKVINLFEVENYYLNNAVTKKDKRLIQCNMQDLEYKLL